MVAIGFIGLIGLFVGGWQLAKLFDKRFIEPGQRAIPLITSDPIDNRSLIESIRRTREHATLERNKNVLEARPSHRAIGRGGHVEPARPRRYGQGVLPNNPREDV